jgi:hypothetical protein
VYSGLYALLPAILRGQQTKAHVFRKNHLEAKSWDHGLWNKVKCVVMRITAPEATVRRSHSLTWHFLSQPANGYRGWSQLGQFSFRTSSSGLFHDWNRLAESHLVTGVKALGFAMRYRVEYFRDNILVKACLCHMALEDAIRTSEQGLVLYKAQVVVVRDLEGNDAEVARIKREAA